MVAFFVFASLRVGLSLCTGLPLCVIASGVQRSAAIQRRVYNEVEVLPIVRQYLLKADNAE